MLSPDNTRRWQRLQVDLPVSVIFQTGTSTMVAPGRGIEISEGGMSLYAGIQLKPYDLVELEFQAPWHTKVTGIVRNGSGCCFGLEFLSPLPIDTEFGARKSGVAPLVIDKEDEHAISISLRMRDLYLHRRRVEIKRLEKELTSLRQFAHMVSEMEKPAEEAPLDPFAPRRRR